MAIRVQNRLSHHALTSGRMFVSEGRGYRTTEVWMGVNRSDVVGLMARR